ncbi:MAG: hypothetical protein Q9M31_00880 [Mariprofundus sp.]|nr:hypothetical protein [Mariprofundus sp.]
MLRENSWFIGDFEGEVSSPLSDHGGNEGIRIYFPHIERGEVRNLRAYCPLIALQDERHALRQQLVKPVIFMTMDGSFIKGVIQDLHLQHWSWLGKQEITRHGRSALIGRIAGLVCLGGESLDGDLAHFLASEVQKAWAESTIASQSVLNTDGGVSL